MVTRRGSWGIASGMLIGSGAAWSASFTVTNTNSIGAGSLTQAIVDANALPGADTINFAIAGAGVKVISVGSGGLPVITDALSINGYSQAGAVANTASAGTNAVLMIELDGSTLSSFQEILFFAAPTTVRGLAFRGFGSQADAIFVGNDGGGSSIRGCFIGTDAAGVEGFGQGRGIVVAASTQIGGGSPADRNLIAGASTGIAMFAGADGTIIQGNLIGTGVDGASDQGNAVGISTGNVTVSDLLIGGTVAGQGNVIAFSNTDGIRLSESANPGGRIRILGNSIFDNGDLGIDLGGDGPDANDPGDTDTGINGRENAPQLEFATLVGSSLFVSGLIDGDFVEGSKRIEFFANSVADASGSGEGRTFLGATLANGAVSPVFLTGFVTITALLPTPFFLTATSTNADGSTSEFSNAIVVSDGGEVRVVTNTNDSGAGSLRQALLDAAAAGPDLIRFNIPGVGPHVIAPLSALPPVPGRTTIDGYSVIDSRFNTLDAGSNAQPKIELDGSLAGAGTNGLTLSGPASRVRGLVIRDFDNVGISIAGGSFHRIDGGYIGTDVSGMLDHGNGASGITVAAAANGIVIGGGRNAQRNLISGNSGAGISTGGDNVSVIDNLIGGTALDAVGMGHPFPGIVAAGTGVLIADNRISSNSRGILVSDSLAMVAIRRNGITANANLGIDLGSEGITSNDVDDVDAGANGLQNFPVLTHVEQLAAGGLRVEGSLDRPAGAGAFTYALDLFRNQACDGSHGEGAVHVLSQDLDFASGAPETFSFDAPVDAGLAAGSVMTATVTNSDGGTSEFSACRTSTVQPEDIFQNGFE